MHVVVSPKRDSPRDPLPSIARTGSDLSRWTGGLLADPRLRLVEISEYASLRDLDRRAITMLVELLAAGLEA